MVIIIPFFLALVLSLASCAHEEENTSPLASHTDPAWSTLAVNVHFAEPPLLSLAKAAAVDSAVLFIEKDGVRYEHHPLKITAGRIEGSFFVAPGNLDVIVVYYAQDQATYAGRSGAFTIHAGETKTLSIAAHSLQLMFEPMPAEVQLDSSFQIGAVTSFPYAVDYELELCEHDDCRGPVAVFDFEQTGKGFSMKVDANGRFSYVRARVLFTYGKSRWSLISLPLIVVPGHFDFGSEVPPTVNKLLFTFDNSTGTTFYDQTARVMGTVFGTPGWVDEGVGGRSLEVDGQADVYASIPSDAWAGTQNLSIRLIVKPSLASFANGRILSQDSSRSPGRHFLCRLLDSGKIQFVVFIEGQALSVTSSEALKPDRWNMLALQATGGKSISVSVNGVTDSIQVPGPLPVVSEPLYLGRYISYEVEGVHILIDSLTLLWN